MNLLNKSIKILEPITIDALIIQAQEIIVDIDLQPKNHTYEDIQWVQNLINSAWEWLESEFNTQRSRHYAEMIEESFLKLKKIQDEHFPEEFL